MKEQIEQYLEAIKANYGAWVIKANYGAWGGASSVRQSMVEHFNQGLEIVPGNKYIKVLTNRSVHSFIVAVETPKFKVGDILMAKSFKAPATNFARGNILDPKFDFSKVRWAGA